MIVVQPVCYLTIDTAPSASLVIAYIFFLMILESLCFTNGLPTGKERKRTSNLQQQNKNKKKHFVFHQICYGESDMWSLVDTRFWLLAVF